VVAAAKIFGYFLRFLVTKGPIWNWKTAHVCKKIAPNSIELQCAVHGLIGCKAEDDRK
jgi:hypothetical protein